ncbi:hypothetical protein MN116_001091 [Schistosoma mekongi]|uniref:Leucine-rich repeat-containing protein 34 n=1 Tax=Schistosoma mekongi TaxID=38744 RepID=A0AAE2DA43_SCHME|nr:hypothetical protein MN116_001091 [Schistosoma mekongi]
MRRSSEILTELNLENLKELESTYVDCLQNKPTPASSFISKIMKMEYELDKKFTKSFVSNNGIWYLLSSSVITVCVNDDGLFAIYLKLCGNNHHLDAIQLTDADLPPLCMALSLKPCITMLDLRYNCIKDNGSEKLCEFLKVDSLLEELNLMGNDITEKGAEFLADSLKSNRSLVILKMTGNPIGSKGGLFFAQALQVNDILEFLDLGECDQDITSCIAFATVLKRNKSVIGINLNRQLLWTLQEEPIVHFADMLRINKTLRELHLSKCDMRDFGATRLSEALERNDTLELLDISANRVSRDGAISLSKIISINCPLVVLDLAFNRVQCKGAKALANALLYNTHLKVLAVQFCEMKGPGLCALAESLITNLTLECIYIWGNEHDESVCNAFAKLIYTNRLTENYTDIKPYVVDGRTYLALLNHDCTYRQYRFSVPWWKFQAPNDRSIALF